MEFDPEDTQTYKAKCNKCEKEIEVITQKDNYPEYYTDVYVRCQCGGTARFVLPVN